MLALSTLNDFGPELWGPPSDETLASVAAKCQHAPECTIVITPKPKPGVA